MLTHAIFAADAAAVACGAWLMACSGGHGRRGALEAMLAWLWSVTALIAGAGIALGVTGGFGPVGFLGVHAALLAVLFFARRQGLAADLAALRTVFRDARVFLNTPGPERLLALGLLLVLAALTAIDAWAQPEVLDALTYHLPRIGHWLQEGQIRMIPTPDARTNFVAALPEVVMAWFLGGSQEGFRSVVLAQALGGIMAVGATVGLARQSGLGRGASLMAAVVLLGMADVTVQFTAAQTDLLTTGIFAVSFYLWLAALRRGESSALGALGAGMALAAKGTLFYLAPGALLWVAWLAWHHPLPWARWRFTLIMGVLGIAFFALPGFVRNWQAYGSALGPAAWVRKHHQGYDSASGLAYKVALNLTSGLAQNLEPQSQPLGLRAGSRAAGGALVGLLPPADPYTLRGIDRVLSLRQILSRDSPDADVTSFGDISLLLFAVAVVLALLPASRPGSRLVLVWSAGIAAYFLFFYAMQQWHPYGFRYLLLGAPWIAVVGAWGIAQLPHVPRRALWVLVALASLSVGWRVTTRTSQAGWQSVEDPARYVGYFVASGWRDWSARLDHADEPFVLALPEERPVSAFYRQVPRRPIAYKPDPGRVGQTAEQFVRGTHGWVIVPAARFLGREGNVAESVWLSRGDAGEVYSVAAFRALDPGEAPRSAVYRRRRKVTGTTATFDLLVRAAREPVRVALSNPAESAVPYAWATPLGHGAGSVGAGVDAVLELPMPAGSVGEIRIVFGPRDLRAAPAEWPSADVVR